MNWSRAIRGFAIAMAECLLVCNIILLFDVIIVSIGLGAGFADADVVVYFVSLLLLLEGGMGLVIGGLLVVSAGPGMTKFGEVVFHGEAYTVQRYRRREGEARLLFLVSVLLMLIGYFMPV